MSLVDRLCSVSKYLASVSHFQANVNTATRAISRSDSCLGNSQVHYAAVVALGVGGSGGGGGGASTRAHTTTCCPLATHMPRVTHTKKKKRKRKTGWKRREPSMCGSRHRYTHATHPRPPLAAYTGRADHSHIGSSTPGNQLLK